MRAHAPRIAAIKRSTVFARDVRTDGPPGRRGNPSRQTPAATAVRRPVPHLRTQTAAAPQGEVRSVFICDDREAVRQELSRAVRLRSDDVILGVTDGRALVSAYQTTTPAQILIGVHARSTFGADAFDLLIRTHPTASAIVFGSISDIDRLARVYARGAAGLLLWEPGQPWTANSAG